MRLLVKQYEKPMTKNEINSLLIFLANDEGNKKLPQFLQQCANQYKDQFMITGDPAFKGCVLAFMSLKERITEKKGKNLTNKKKSGKIKTSY